MKQKTSIVLVIFLFGSVTSFAQFGDILKKVGSKAEEKVNKAEDTVVNKIMNPETKSPQKKDDNVNTNNQTNQAGQANQQQISTKTYQNYDFVPEDSKHNMELSQQRADAVKTQLVSMGIDVSRLTTKGFGDTKPIADNSTPEGKTNNRRIEFVKI